MSSTPPQPPGRLSVAAVIGLVAAAYMLQPLSTDLYLPTLPGIGAAFDVSVATVQLTLSVYIAAFGLWQLVAGPLSDRYGRHPVVIGGIATFLAASILCVFAPTIEVLVGGRLLQAIGACSCLIGTRAMVRDLYAPTEGARVMAAASTLMAVAPVTGPVIGALAFEAFGWRSSFVLLAGFSAVLLAVSAMRLQESNTRPDPQVLRPGPMLEAAVRILRSPTFIAYALMVTLSYAGLFAYLAGSPFVLIRVFGLSPTAYGLALPLMSGGFLLGSFLCQRLLPSRGIAYTTRLGATLQAASGIIMVALALAGVHHPAAIIAPMSLFGVSHGLVQPAGMAAAVAPFPRNAGLAAALYGVAMMGAASLVSLVQGATFNDTVFPMVLSLGATSVTALIVALTLVRRYGEI